MFVNGYSHLSLEEREKLYGWKQKGLSLREIAKRLGRSHSSLVRELKRHIKYGKLYLPCLAEKRAHRWATKQRYQAPLKCPLIFLYVREKLRLGWSPETIAGRLRIDYPDYSITDETIYRYIYGRKQKRMKLWRYLTLGRKKRRLKQGRRVHCSTKIPEAVSIDFRPSEVQERKAPGHWETDNMEGVRSDASVMSVTVERLARLTLLSKMNARTANSKTQAVVTRLSGFPKALKQTITADNGAENTEHTTISQKLGLAGMYFCHPYHSWEKGTVENTIGRVRRFFPKGKSIETLTDEEVAAVEYSLNSTPRKCLGFLTPYEKMDQLLRNS